MTVQVSDIETGLGRPLSTAEQAQATRWIADALLLIKARLGDPAALDQENLDYVVREAVIAQFKNPDDATQVSVTVDDGTLAKTYRSSRGRVTIVDEWWDLLAPREVAGAFSIRPSGGYTRLHQPWCALTFGALYCSCGADIADEPIYEGVWGFEA